LRRPLPPTARWATSRCKNCRSLQRGANTIFNFKEIENWENDVIFCNFNFAARRGGAPILPVSENDATFCIPIQWNAKSGIVFAYRFVPQFFAVICNLGRSKEHQWANVNANNVTNIVNIAIHRDFIFKENEELKGTNPILRIGKTMPFLQSNTFNSQFQRN
jgi:hypothetical protein